MINYDRVKEELTPENIIQIIQTFIPDLQYEENLSNGCLILPTICHNLEQEEGSRKLYYYFNTHLFHCYTHCGSFDIYELVKKMLELRGLDSDFNEVFKRISTFASIDYSEEISSAYHSIASRYDIGDNAPALKEYPSIALEAFDDIYPIEWINDGISPYAMRRYGIKYCIPRNQAIIPHYDISSRLVGIRVRNFDEDQIERGGKYMPALIQNKFYTHPLAYNLYGIDKCKDAISRKGLAIIVEGEKSVLLGDTWYGKDNVIVATCGDKFNRYLIKMLASLGAKDIIIAYDRMNHDKQSREIYFNKLYSMCEKYKNYANFSFIFDRDYILEYKAAPLDSGVETFEKLLARRVYVR